MADDNEAPGDKASDNKPDEATVGKPESTVNTQITDSLAALQSALEQGASEHAVAMAELARVQATALKDFQAVARQQADATIMSATATAAVAKMMSVPLGVGGSGAGLVPLVEAQAMGAISMLRAQRDAAGSDASAAADALTRVREATQASPSDKPSASKTDDR